MSDIPPIPRRPPDAAGAAPCCTAASAGKEVAAAEAAPRIRIKDLRDTPVQMLELIRLSSVAYYARLAIWDTRIRRRNDRKSCAEAKIEIRTCPAKRRG